MHLPSEIDSSASTDFARYPRGLDRPCRSRPRGSIQLTFLSYQINAGPNNHGFAFYSITIFFSALATKISCLRALKPPPAHGGRQCAPKFAAYTAASTVWCFEAPVVFRQFHSCRPCRSARCVHRLDLETKTLAARWALFFPSRRAGGAV